MIYGKWEHIMGIVEAIHTEHDEGIEQPINDPWEID